MNPLTSLNVLYEDRHCLVVCKPSRVLTASDSTGDETLLEMARAHNAAQQDDGKKGYLAPLHMLDRPASGVVIFAKSSKAASRLSEQFRKGTVSKIYNTLVEGHLEEAEEALEDWLLKDRSSNRVSVAWPDTKGAKKCRLTYARKRAAADMSWLEIRLETGRSHQIRVQLSSRGWPIYGDQKYGASSAFDGAIALHASLVSFEHPVSKETITVRAPLPETWRAIWPGPWPKDFDHV